jgi:hypothetical protein
MNARANIGGQLGLNAWRALPTLAVSTTMVLGGDVHPAAIPYATERRVAVWTSKLQLDGEAELDPQPVGDSRPVPPDTAATYKATWRTVPTEAILENLKKSGVLWFVGGPTLPGSSRKRVHLDPKVGDRRQAELICRWAIERAGGDPSDLELNLPNAERIRLGVEAIRRFEREEAVGEIAGQRSTTESQSPEPFLR